MKYIQKDIHYSITKKEQGILKIRRKYNNLSGCRTLSLFTYTTFYVFSSHDIPLPHITPHIFRHTYCSRLANKGVNPKVVQKLLGHAKIDTTLNVYTHASLENILSELKRVSIL